MDVDRIVKAIELPAPKERVWQAVGDSSHFGHWFGAEFDGPFVSGAPLSGRIVPTKVDPEVAKMQEPHRGTPFTIRVEAVEPMRRFAFRWHPYPVGPGADPAREPTTLVSFELADAEGGTRLTITESGFEAVPAERRARAVRDNDAGWTHQARLIEKYLALHPQ